MGIESYLGLTQTSERQDDSDSRGHDTALESLIHRKSGILNRKLEILAAEIWWRLHIATKNVQNLDEEHERIGGMLQRLDRAANYQLREHQEKGVLYRAWLDTETQQRSEEVECWRDVVHVMRDFLYTWDAHQQAQSKAMFLDHVGD